MEKSTKVNTSNHDPFSFTKPLLLALGLVFMLAMFIHAIIDTETTANIWRSVSAVIPPMATFVIGLYFGRKR